MNNEDAAFRYKKVYLFVTDRINETPEDRFWMAGTKDWNFSVYEKDVYFNENKVRLFIEFWNSQEEKSLEQIVAKAFEVKKGMQKLRFEKLKGCEKKGTLNLPAESEEVGKMMGGISYLKIEPCFRDFVDVKYEEYVAYDDTYKNWKKIYYIDNREKGVVACALNDYKKEIYRDEFIDHIYHRLPLLFPAEEYYVFIHGRYLIKDKDETCIEVKMVKGNEFHIKTFHHTLSYVEYKFLISQEEFNYLYLELLFDETVREALKEVNKCVILILANPEFVEDERIQTLVRNLDLLKLNRKIADDAIFKLTELVDCMHKGCELVNLLNDVVAKSRLLGVK